MQRQRDNMNGNCAHFTELQTFTIALPHTMCLKAGPKPQGSVSDVFHNQNFLDVFREKLSETNSNGLYVKDEMTIKMSIHGERLT